MSLIKNLPLGVMVQHTWNYFQSNLTCFLIVN